MWAVGFVSAGTLSYEILLVRIFAIEHFHHFAYMAIGVAMLGFGVSGTLLALLGRSIKSRAPTWFVWSGILTAVCLVLSPALVHQVSLDPTRLAWDPNQWLNLTAVYALLALPFATGAMTILLALVLESERPGATYGINFVGSGLGALFALFSVSILSPHRALAVPAFIAAVGAAVGASYRPRGLHTRGTAWIVLALAAFVCFQPLWRLEVSQYKGLSQVEAYPDARRVAEIPSPIGWVVAVDAPTFRYAPGLSLGYSGPFPRQLALFVDGQIAGATLAAQERGVVDSVFEWLPTALPYSVGAVDQALVIGAGGGTEVRVASAHGVAKTVAVEIHPELVEFARDAGAGEQSGVVEWVVADARSYVARTRDSFDLISIAPAGGFGSAAAGIMSMNEDFLHTVEAYTAYLQRLTVNGRLAITRWLSIPPRENVRVLLTAVAAMRQLGLESVENSLMVLRSWGTVTILVKPSGFTEAELDSLVERAHAKQFDVDWHRGIGEPVSLFNHLEEPTLHRAATAAVESRDSLNRFAASYPFNVAPVNDARPYPHHFLRLFSLGQLLEQDRGAWLPFAEWGPIALVATLVQSGVLAIVLLLVPVMVFNRGGSEQRTWPCVFYFLAIGFAYMATEIAMIQQLSLLLGHPVYAVAVVLATFLICSGIGSIWSDRLPPARGWLINAGLLALLILCAPALLASVHLLQPTPMPIRAAGAAILACPLAFLMGMPFPHGVRLLVGGSQTKMAWAWAANGFASVIAAPLAALITLERGSPELFLLAAVAYGIAGILAKEERDRVS